MQYQSQELEEDRIILEEDLDPDYEPSDEGTLISTHKFAL